MALHQPGAGEGKGDPERQAETRADAPGLSTGELSLTLSLSLGALVVSGWVDAASRELGLQIPAILVLTTVALILASFPGPEGS